jgi:3-polyprenyl-4-hydroxybenzoate decarboxylase
MDTLDYTGPAVNEGSKGVWVGLGEPVRELPRQFAPARLPAGVTDVHVFCGGCLVVGGPAYAAEPAAAARLAGDPAFAEWPLVVLSDEPARAVRSDMNFLWTTFTRFEPGADIHAAERRIVRNHIAYRAPIVIDARLKPTYPTELVPDEATAARVSRRWAEYFPSGRIEMGDSVRGHLD